MSVVPPCRVNADPRVVSRKMSRLREPHIAEISALVDALRVERRDDSIPYIDPDLGGVRAKVLFLFQDPGPKCSPATGGSGLVSPSNNDPSADNMCTLMHQARLAWSDITIWNAVPWYTGGANSASDLEDGVDALCRLLEIVPDVRVVVTGGGTASNSWRRATQLRPDLGKYPRIGAPHPSTRGLTRGSRQPIEVGRSRLMADMIEAKRIAGIR